MIRAFAVAAALLVPAVAGAHISSEKGFHYPQQCCRGSDVGGDCAAIPDSAVEATSDGFLITLEPGGHPMIFSLFQIRLTYDNGSVAPSLDGRYHICIGHDEHGNAFSRCFWYKGVGA